MIQCPKAKKLSQRFYASEPFVGHTHLLVAFMLVEATVRFLFPSFILASISLKLATGTDFCPSTTLQQHHTYTS